MSAWRRILVELESAISERNGQESVVLVAAQRVVDRHRLRPCPDSPQTCSICNLGTQLDMLNNLDGVESR